MAIDEASRSPISPAPLGDPQLHATTSLFAHEHAALVSIGQFIDSHQLGITLTNLDLNDPQSNRYFEVDLVVLSTFGIYVVELKHWSGRIEIRPNSWVQNNSFFKPDPHKANNFKAKLIKGFFERKFPQFPRVYFESVVVLTNPEVAAQGVSIPTTTSNNPTFDSVERFLQYLKVQRKNPPRHLTEAQLRDFAEYLRKLHTAGAPRDFMFPGYEIIDRLYQHVDRAEVIAKRTDIRHRRLSRLRIFYLLSERSEEEKRRAHERATATLNAVAKVGDHPNILKVWAVPNENNYIVEGSDWSETGTLRDVLEREGALCEDRVRAIAFGLANGLASIHQHCVVHRALSPENILIVNDAPKLMNFDLSFQLEEDRVTVIPDAARLKRSPYISPEIYAGGDIPDGKADLFSLGVIIYELLTGSRPFGCSTDLERTNGVLTDSQRRELEKRNVSSSLTELIFDLVQRDPLCRPGDVLVVIKRLETVKELVPVGVRVNARLLPGEQSGLYVIEDFLTSGAESQLYIARGVEGRKIALKVFDRDVPQQRVVNEHRLTGAVLHSNIVRVDSYGQWPDDRYFIAFEWASSRNLRDEITERTNPDSIRFIHVANQALRALAALHNEVDEDGCPHPILHNDIKPENILMAPGDRPIFVDFGAASEPRVGTYEGTEGYVAPDLRLGPDRQYSEDGDRYALAVTLWEWLNKRESALDIGGPDGKTQEILAWLRKGSAPNSVDRFASIGEMQSAFQLASMWTAPESTGQLSGTTLTSPDLNTFEQYIQKASDHDSTATADSELNAFVPYLNSLHSRNAETDNALAESQALNSFFPLIQVSHPIVGMIEAVLLGSNKTHVILTGHAGDGKSTIAVELLKRLRGVPTVNPLGEALKQREEFAAKSISISLIKDFSEWSASDRQELLAEMLVAQGKRFLLISNTGTMLDTFRSHENSGDWAGIESELLAAMGQPQGGTVHFHESAFLVLNMAMIDNLGIARKIFERMLDPDRWLACSSCGDRHHCPIVTNVTLIQANQAVVTDRMFLAYRRMFEYGTRLTLRQLSAHMAYMITSGLSHDDASAIARRANPPLMAEFMFFNRFFGDNGVEIDEPALQIRAVRAAREEGFGDQPSPTWERRLWLNSRGQSFTLRAAATPEDCELLLHIGAGKRIVDSITGAQAREQVRRIVFFLHSFETADDGRFLSSYLKSEMLLAFARWQAQFNNVLSLQEATLLKRQVIHVLQEHFTGVRLPEGISSDQYLIVTLSRRSNELRQSAQIVLARYPEADFRIHLLTASSGTTSSRRELVFDGIGQNKMPMLTLSLPFLDYVMMRNQGEVGRNLQASFVDRLERFKGELIRLSKSKQSDGIMLVRLRTNNMFKRQIFSVRDDRMDVTDG